MPTDPREPHTPKRAPSHVRLLRHRHPLRLPGRRALAPTRAEEPDGDRGERPEDEDRGEHARALAVLDPQLPNGRTVHARDVDVPRPVEVLPGLRVGR